MHQVRMPISVQRAHELAVELARISRCEDNLSFWVTIEPAQDNGGNDDGRLAVSVRRTHGDPNPFQVGATIDRFSDLLLPAVQILAENLFGEKLRTIVQAAGEFHDAVGSPLPFDDSPLPLDGKAGRYWANISLTLLRTGLASASMAR